MPLHTQASAPGTGSFLPAAGLLLLTVVLTLALASPALARSKPHLKELDLDIRPGDVALQPRAPTAEPLTDAADIGQDLPIDPNAVAQTDQIERTELPRQRRSEGGDGSGEGSVLEQILQDHTIPLFRVRMNSPF
ncbi:hypothetical protein [Benzoatithermus flavus]|uniref:Uncharacterized protein n=1 Tax=Benzoatithermus flavus TaxID=3108223 RepID=A0ABU8XS69_9PROT